MRIKNEVLYPFFIFLLFLSFSCSEEQRTIILEEEQEEEPPMQDLEMLTQEELDYITDLLIVDNGMEDSWQGFDYFRTYPIYILTSENEGIFINPPTSELPNSRKIFNEIGVFEGLDMYRNDELLAYAQVELSGAIFYDQYAEFNGYNVFLYDVSKAPPSGSSSDYKNRNGYFHVSVFYHELFHVYQHNTYEVVIYPNFFFNFPINEDTLPLLILLFDVMIDAYDIDTEPDRLKHLGLYVSIAGALESVDDSENKLIRNFGFAVEKGEGSARYVEVFSTLYTLNNNTIEDPTHGAKEYMDTGIESAINVRQLFSRRMYYHTGAGAIHLLKQLNFNNFEDTLFLTPLNTPYDMAADFLDLSTLEREILLQEAKDRYNWDDIIERANYLLSLD